MNLSPRWGFVREGACVPGVETPGYCIESLSGPLKDVEILVCRNINTMR